MPAEVHVAFHSVFSCPLGREHLFPCPRVSPCLPHWVNLDLHQLLCWHKSKLTREGGQNTSNTAASNTAPFPAWFSHLHFLVLPHHLLTDFVGFSHTVAIYSSTQEMARDGTWHDLPKSILQQWDYVTLSQMPPCTDPILDRVGTWTIQKQFP